MARHRTAGRSPTPELLPRALEEKLLGLRPWWEGSSLPATAPHLPCEADGIVHLGSYAHEFWSIQREVRAVTERETSVEEAAARGLHGRHVMCWAPGFWRAIPEDRKRGNRVVCLFHHTDFELVHDPQIAAAVCLNRRAQEILEAERPGIPVWVAGVGGAEDALPHARRQHPSRKIRLMLAGSAPARMPGKAGGAGSRKGADLIQPIAERLDRRRFAWVFVGVGWEEYARILAGHGWTVLYPGPLQTPGHYVWFGEGDVFLMLSRLEGVPLTLVETMGLGLWPVCTPTGLAPDVVRHGINGHLLPQVGERTADEIADLAASHLQSLDRALLEERRPLVRQSVAHLTWSRFRERMATILAEVFGPGEPA